MRPVQAKAGQNPHKPRRDGCEVPPWLRSHWPLTAAVREKLFPLRGLDGRNMLEWRTAYPRGYGQHKLDLRGFKKEDTVMWVGMRDRSGRKWGVCEYNKNTLYKILKNNLKNKMQFFF